MIGDSQLCGMKPYVRRLAEQYDDVVSGDCRTGSRVSAWAGHRFAEDADVVIVVLGTNDYATITVPNVAPILQSIQRVNARCVWVGPTAVRGKVWPVNELLKEAVSSVCMYVDLSHESTSDGVHVRNFSDLASKIWSTIPHSK